MTVPAGNDDTIELQLTPEQLLGLSQAAESAASASPEPVAMAVAPSHVPMTPTFNAGSALPAAQPFIKDLPLIRPPRWHQSPLAKMTANTLLFVAFVWWSVSQLAGQPQAHPQLAAAAAVRPIAVVAPAAVAAPPPAPVQVVNPFDRTEVFQFPAGTSAAESRDKVAQILLQRAHERQSHWEHARPEASLRTASLTAIRKSTGPGT
jgi:hypothetical protein